MSEYWDGLQEHLRKRLQLPGYSALIIQAVREYTDDAVAAERECIAAWLEAKAAEYGDDEIPHALQIAAWSIRNDSYERTLELRDAPGT